ncbi:MAG: Asp-tRNA(Asn)/Glu-tRNA(Gln) amidotransferase subunit GatC [Deltaproteobacteria bacterium]|jgi:aspartyl-tRNA(Asn)/glutamyl-tRNA(Gln) amidotransferase subunit C|nr:Asp-tRNA(Asn)/Glu-tRNA(Gln) amidotransferase subunit GatC [Deltaproteobacteria bacterium]
MSVSKATVLRAGRLARLSLDEGAGLEDFAGQMAGIVEYMDILNQADTCGVEPMFSPMSRTAPPVQDEPATAGAGQPCPREDILRNAPEQADGLFVVPRIL